MRSIWEGSWIVYPLLRNYRVSCQMASRLALHVSATRVCNLVQEAFVVMKQHGGKEAGGKRCLAVGQRKID